MKDIAKIDWSQVFAGLNSRGFYNVPKVLSAEECQDISRIYANDRHYRKTIQMERYRFGKGEYKYFRYPLPPPIHNLREAFYPPLSVLANEWMTKLQIETIFPPSLEGLLSECRSVKQILPTPLILRYKAGGFNTLHQDLYGDIYFPFQVVCMLSQPGTDYKGGAFVITEQVPRAQSRADVIEPEQGDALIITTNFRPVSGTRGYYRSRMKHGVSEVKEGERYALGLIFHDAA